MCGGQWNTCPTCDAKGYIIRIKTLDDAIKRLVRKLGRRRAIRILLTAFDPLNENYVGHNLAKKLKMATCICPPERMVQDGKDQVMEQDRDMNCPFHGR
jgi:hypothetical protein